jgi:hypothetical protein
VGRIAVLYTNLVNCPDHSWKLVGGVVIKDNDISNSLKRQNLSKLKLDIFVSVCAV